MVGEPVLPDPSDVLRVEPMQEPRDIMLVLFADSREEGIIFLFEIYFNLSTVLLQQQIRVQEALGFPWTLLS